MFYFLLYLTIFILFSFLFRKLTHSNPNKLSKENMVNSLTIGTKFIDNKGLSDLEYGLEPNIYLVNSIDNNVYNISILKDNEIKETLNYTKKELIEIIASL